MSDMQKVYDFLKEAQVYYLATVEDNKPHVRPFGTVNIFENKLYIQTGHAKAVAKQIAANPNVELTAFNGKQWIRLRGQLVDDTRVEAKKDMLEHYPNLQSMYSAEDENTAVFYFKNATATIESFTSPKEVITF